MDWLSFKEIDPVGAAGLLLAAYALFRQGRTERQQKREREVDAGTAKLSVSRDGDRLIIRNDGPGTALYVRVWLDARPIEDHPAIYNRVSPIPAIGPNGEFSYTMAVESAISPSEGATVKVGWSDDSAQFRHLLTTIR
jgi:hypothetical protein